MIIPTVDDSWKSQSVVVHSGEVYEFLFDVHTRGGLVHETGDLLEVLDSTQRAPYGEVSQSGVNWVCKTKYSTSIWATLEQCIARGLLRLRA